VSDGRYHVTRDGSTGVRYLHLFQRGDTGRDTGYCVITLDPADDVNPEGVAVGIHDMYRDWSVDAFAALLDSLEAVK